MNTWIRLYEFVNFSSLFVLQDFVFEHRPLVLQNADKYENQRYQVNEKVHIFV